MSVDRVNIHCTVCGSEQFKLPNKPPLDDDIIECGGCGKTIGRYADIREAATNQMKSELEGLMSKAFKKPIKLDWKKQ